MHHHPKAFTLAELLTVVTIVGLLLAMVIPSIGSAYSMAQETNCNSNLSVIGKAVLAYTQANDDRLPLNGKKDIPTDDSDEGQADRLPGTNSNLRWWCNKIYPLGQRDHSLYSCGSNPANAGDLVASSYGFNDTLTDPNSEGGDGIVTSMQINDPGMTFLVGHCSEFTEEPAIAEGMMTPEGADWPSGHVVKWDQEARKQLGRGGFLMASGDVKTLTYSQVKRLKLRKGDGSVDGTRLKFFHKD